MPDLRKLHSEYSELKLGWRCFWQRKMQPRKSVSSRNRESEQAGGADPLTSGVHCRGRPRSWPRVHRSARAPAQPGHIWVLEGKPETAVLEIFWAQRAQRQGLIPSADQGGGPSPPPATWSTGRAEARRLGQGKGPLGPTEGGAGVLTGVGAQQKPAGSCLDISTVGYPGILGGGNAH